MRSALAVLVVALIVAAPCLADDPGITAYFMPYEDPWTGPATSPQVRVFTQEYETDVSGTKDVGIQWSTDQSSWTYLTDHNRNGCYNPDPIGTGQGTGPCGPDPFPYTVSGMASVFSAAVKFTAALGDTLYLRGIALHGGGTYYSNVVPIYVNSYSQAIE